MGFFRKAPEVVVITGASAGVGRAAVREFAEHGTRVALIARGAEGLDAARREVEAAGGRALALQCDVSDADCVMAAAESVEDELGPIDIWVNNAMATVFAPVTETTPEEYKRVLDVTFLGYVHGTLAALKHMMPRNRGTIVQVGSALAFRAIPLQSAYCAAKHAIRGFTESLRTELLHDRSNIHVTAVHLPAVNTPQFDWQRSKLSRRPQPIGPIFQPEVAARAIYWAAHHRRRELFVGAPTSEAVAVDKFAPDVTDRYLARTAFDAQLSAEGENPERPDSLYVPVPGDHGAHGRFDDESKRHSVQLWMSTHRGLLALAATGLGLAVIARR